FIEPFLPPKAKVGRPRADDRLTINGILYVLTTGCRWMDMPIRYGSYKTAWKRLKLFKAIVSMRSHDRVCVDCSTVEAKKGENL
ncbi:MAG: transposase, partial [Candidatus Bathyarchaeia archaeon]